MAGLDVQVAVIAQRLVKKQFDVVIKDWLRDDHILAWEVRYLVPHKSSSHDFIPTR